MKPHERIQELETEGYMVKITHRRPLVTDDLGDYWVVARTVTSHGLKLKREELKRSGHRGNAIRFSAKGGETVVTILHPDRDEVFAGVAFCSEKDNFNKRLGVQIALGRAIKRKERRRDLADRLDWELDNRGQA